MIEMDLEDYIEEVKFQMVDAYDDVLDKETILTWEKKAREWVQKEQKKCSYKITNCYPYKNLGALKEQKKCSYLRFRSKDEIYVQIKNEEVCEKIAKKFYEAVINKTEEEYWKDFKLC